MTTPIIEAMAMAIYGRRPNATGNLMMWKDEVQTYNTKIIPWEGLSQDEQSERLADARAALAALAEVEPSEGMLAVEIVHVHAGSGPPHFHGSQTSVRRGDASIFHAMLQQAVKEASD